jgi:hypothetical protein
LAGHSKPLWQLTGYFAGSLKCSRMTCRFATGQLASLPLAAHHQCTQCTAPPAHAHSGREASQVHPHGPAAARAGTTLRRARTWQCAPGSAAAQAAFEAALDMPLSGIILPPDNSALCPRSSSRLDRLGGQGIQRIQHQRQGACSSRRRHRGAGLVRANAGRSALACCRIRCRGPIHLALLRWPRRRGPSPTTRCTASRQGRS